MIPSRHALVAAERATARLGHENLGFLSHSHGFLPRVPPSPALPASHALWDAVAADLPALHRTLTVRSALDALPVLPAGSLHLPDDALLRAATVLGVLAHAYQYSSVHPPARLPGSVVVPWTEVLGRLGRRHPVLSYVDLIVHNWRLVDPAAVPAMRVPNLRLLVPTVDNQEERVFYLTQTEILARCAPLVAAVVAAQEAAVAGDADTLELHLGTMRDVLVEVTTESLPTIDPVATSPTYVDAVVWARTVAPFAVPFVEGVPGPSGTSSPIFALLDTFLGRAAHDSFLGREILALRATYPPHWRRFLGAVGQVDVAGHVARHGGARVRALLEEVEVAYAGPAGFLGRHRRKVLGYLDTAFKVGRSVTIGGFRGGFADRTWEEIDDELEAARRERSGAVPAGAPARPLLTPNGAVRSQPAIPLSELVVHNDDHHGHWIAIDGAVHDVTSFRRRHPGGHRILQAYAGTDATAVFARPHGTDDAVKARRDRLVIGRLVRPRLGDEAVSRAWSAWAGLLQTVVEMQNALRHDHELQVAVTTAGERPESVTPFKLERGLDTFDRFVRGQAEPLARHHLPALATVTFGDPPGDLVGVAPASERSDATGLPHPPRTVPVLEAAATAFLADLKAGLRLGVTVFERHGDQALAAGATDLRAAFTSLDRAVHELDRSTTAFRSF